MNYQDYTFIVSGRKNYDLNTALSLWKTKYPEYIDFYKDVITHEALQDFGEFVKECWDSITPVTVEQALALPNAEDRSTYFDCIGVEKLFKQLKPKLRDKQVIKKKRTKWDDNNDPIEYEFEDVYELYEIDGKKLFETNRWGRDADPVYAVRCWCTTTNREYWLYVNSEAALGHSRWQDTKEYNAINAIAWTIRIDATYPEKIYRQGDIIIVKMSEHSKPSRLYHLTKDVYLNLMYSET